MLEIMLASKQYQPAPSTFHGEIASADFISGSALAAAVGFTTGTAWANTAPWLSFTYNEKRLFVPKNALRSNVSWRSLYRAGIVHGTDDAGVRPAGEAATLQNKRVTIGDKVYRVRLLRGSDDNPFTTGMQTGRSEWNDLFYPITADSKITSYTGPKIANPYTPAQLGYVTMSKGDSRITQEISGTNCLTRGTYTGATYASVTTASSGGVQYESTINGWLPCLELIE